MQKFSVKAEPVALFGILQLSALQVELPGFPFEHRSHQTPQVAAFLADPLRAVLLGVIRFQYFRDRVKTHLPHILIHRKRYGGKLCGHILPVIDDVRGKCACPDILHQLQEDPRKMKLFIRTDLLRAPVAFQPCPAADLLGDDRADPGEAHIDSLVQRLGFPENSIGKCLPSGRQRIQLLLGHRDKVFSSRKHFPDRRSLSGDMLEGIDDPSILITEDQVGMLSHKLQDQILPPQITHLIIMLDLKVNDALEGRLPDAQDLPAADMLAKKLGAFIGLSLFCCVR